jgi:predicted hotdog family 3-hydroxylacyl-ACP dehydratase
MQGPYPVLQPPIHQGQIRQLIPHAGAMCLLDSATFWDRTRICCQASSHLDPCNPLRREGMLRAVTGIEYAAQAMALHGALLQGGARARNGYLVSVREMRCHASTLEVAAAPLVVEAERVAGNGSNVVYAFALRAAGTELVSGRAMVVLS